MRIEIEKRRVEKERHDMNRMRAGLGIVSAVLVFILVLILKATPDNVVGVPNSGYYASLMLSPESGKFVICGVICFMLGIVITIIARKKW